MYLFEYLLIFQARQVPGMFQTHLPPFPVLKKTGSCRKQENNFNLIYVNSAIHLLWLNTKKLKMKCWCMIKTQDSDNFVKLSWIIQCENHTAGKIFPFFANFIVVFYTIISWVFCFCVMILLYIYLFSTDFKTFC